MHAKNGNTQQTVAAVNSFPRITHVSSHPLHFQTISTPWHFQSIPRAIWIAQPELDAQHAGVHFSSVLSSRLSEHAKLLSTLTALRAKNLFQCRVERRVAPQTAPNLLNVPPPLPFDRMSDPRGAYGLLACVSAHTMRWRTPSVTHERAHAAANWALHIECIEQPELVSCETKSAGDLLR